MLKVGVKVVRGPHWSWRDEDGGEGYTGTLYDIDDVNKTAIIQWDNGNQTLCKIGQMNKYELRIIDNAQIGVRHKNIECNACSSHGSSNIAGHNEEDVKHWGIYCHKCKSGGHIRGKRYKCHVCFDFDLCESCYLGNEHDVSHSFIRIDSQNSEGIAVSPRLKRRRNQEQETVHRGIQCNECNLLNIRGIRYKCNYCYNCNLCDLCYHGNKHVLNHSFKRFDSPKGPSIDLPPRQTSRRNLKEEPIHLGIWCNKCRANVRGIRYKCRNCYDYDLCDTCYHGNEHDVTHSFIRIDLPDNLGVYLMPRSASMKSQTQETIHRGVSCNGCGFRNIHGIRYKCINCYNYDLCDLCYRGNKHDLDHSFTRFHSPNCPSVNLLPRLMPSKVEKGSIHTGVRCDECNSSSLRGTRYKCNNCPNYDLCESCYNANKHDVNHFFRRIDFNNSVGINLPPRSTSEKNNTQDTVYEDAFWNECYSTDIHGMRYKCNNCNNYNLCYICYHGDKHDLSHSFTIIESPQSIGLIILPPRLTSRKCQLRGIFKGAKVIQGIDWNWDNQDGEQSQPGVVLSIVKFNSNDSWRSAAYVKWAHGKTQLCRLGYRGYCDIQLVEAAPDSIQYYPEHLPLLGQSQQMMLQEVITDQQINQVQHISDTENITYLSEQLSLNKTKKSSHLVGSTSSISESNTGDNLNESTASDERVKQLQIKIAQLEESLTCAICLENKRDVVFLCGHGTCSICADSLVLCHLCRIRIDRKIHIY